MIVNFVGKPSIAKTFFLSTYTPAKHKRRLKLSYLAYLKKSRSFLYCLFKTKFLAYNQPTKLDLTKHPINFNKD